MSRFDYAAQRLSLDPGLYKVLRHPEKQIIVAVPVHRDNGEVEVYTGYRVIHNSSRGPAKGGIRFDMNVHAGRGEGAGRVDDVEVRGREHPVRWRQGRRHLRSVHACRWPSWSASPAATPPRIIDTLGPDSDVPAPDVNTNERVMAWVMDTYSMHKRHTVTAVVTGKPIEMGGSLGRREATGRGCMIVTREALARLGLPVKGARVAVQGFGNVGSITAQLLEQAGLHHRRGERQDRRHLQREGPRCHRPARARAQEQVPHRVSEG